MEVSDLTMYIVHQNVSQHLFGQVCMGMYDIVTGEIKPHNCMRLLSRGHGLLACPLSFNLQALL